MRWQVNGLLETHKHKLMCVGLGQTAETQTLDAENHAVEVQIEENASADLELLEEQMLHTQATMLILFQRLFDQKVFTMELFQECVSTMLGD